MSELGSGPTPVEGSQETGADAVSPSITVNDPVDAPPPRAAKKAATLIEALVENNAINPAHLDRGTVPATGTIELLKPMHSSDVDGDALLSDSLYSIKAEDLWELSHTLQANGMVDFQYLNSGSDAIVFTATNLNYHEQKADPANLLRSESPVLRIHLGAPDPARLDCPDVMKAVSKPITINHAITCEEVPYVNVPPPNSFDFKMIIGLGISCLANGWNFEDWRGANNMIQRVGDTRVGILEPQAVNLLPSHFQNAAEFYTERFLKYLGNRRYMHDESRMRMKLHAREASDRTMDTQYSHGDVVETLSNTVVILNGDFYKSNYAGTISEHPCLEERRALIKRILADENCTDYKEFMDEFIVIPQPNTYPPDNEKLFKSMSLAQKLRTALNDHEQARLETVAAPPKPSEGYLGSIVNGSPINSATTGTSSPYK